MERVPDADLPTGHTIVESSGSPPLATSVRRKVYTADGKLLREDVFYSSYRGQPQIVLVGTKAAAKKKQPKPTTTSTTTTTTTTTTATTTAIQP